MTNKRFTSAFLEGLLTPVEGWTFLRTHPGLWRYAWLPLAINVLVSLLLFLGLLYGMGAVSGLVADWLPRGWGWSLLRVGFDVLLAIVALGVTVGTTVLLSALLASYFYSRLADRVERMAGTPPSELPGVSAWGETVDTVLSLAELMVANLLVLGVSFVPVVGPLVSPFLVWITAAFILGMKYFEFPLAVRGWRRKKIRRFCGRHLAQTLGLGSSLFFFNLIPVLGSIAACATVVGATLLERRCLLEEDSLSSKRALSDNNL